MSLINRNSQNRQAARTATVALPGAAIQTQIANVFGGSVGGSMNFKATWAGYDTNGNGLAHVANKQYTANAVNGFRGLPYGSPVVLRVAKGYIALDFQ